MLRIQIQVVDGRVVRLYSGGLTADTTHIYTYKEALGRLRDTYSTWELLVPRIIAYLIDHYPSEDWCIQVLNDGVELRRFELRSNH